MSAALSAIPVPKRRQLAVVLAAFGLLFIAVGAVTATRATTASLTIIAVLALLIGVLLVLLAWGVVVSVKRERVERRIDAAVEEALAANGKSLRNLSCGCGHEHDPDELHVTDAPCAQDGMGVECAHSCDTCVLARTRTS